jgi:serine/threonine-protein kinase
MEYLEGRTLHELIYSEGPLSLEDAVDYILQVLAALAEAHGVGIVHRDLKPANVFLSRGIGGVTVAKVLDFGVSKMLGSTSQRLTRTGAVVGTVAYMAPEQMLDAKRVDGRADLWSAGLLLYEALTRRHAFGALSTGPKAVTAILKNPLTPLASVRQNVPPALDAIVCRLLEKVPDQRFSTAIEVATALAPFGTLRSRPALEEIRRAQPPSGAAAPNAGSGRHTPRASQRPSSAPPRKKSSLVLGLTLAFLTSGLVLSALAGFLFFVKPRWSKSAPLVVPVTSTESPASADLPRVSSSAPPPTVSVSASASATPKPDCDPPFVYDPIANVRRSKPECLE